MAPLAAARAGGGRAGRARGRARRGPRPGRGGPGPGPGPGARRRGPAARAAGRGFGPPPPPPPPSEGSGKRRPGRGGGGVAGGAADAEGPGALAAALTGTGLAFVGDDGALNRSVADLAAAALNYVPLHTEDIVLQAASASEAGPSGASPGGAEALLETMGEEDLGAAEALVLESLSTTVRCSLSTCGGGRAATARPFCWRHLHGHFCVWLDGSPGEPPASEEPQREVYALADLQVRIDPAVLGQPGAAEQVLSTVVPAVQATLLQQPGLVNKKQLYVKLGCKGDWPDLSLEGTGLEEQAKAIERQIEQGGGGEIRI